METLTRAQLNRATLARQMLLAREEASAVEAVQRLCGMQAQEAKPPYIGLWTRLAKFGPEDLRDALHERRLVRATMMRGTLHLMSGKDYLAFRAPIKAVLENALRYLGDRAKGLEVDKVLPEARRLFERQPRTFNELRPLLVEAFPEVNDRALGYVVRNYLPLVMVPTQDRWSFPSVASFTLADEWLGKPPSPDESREGLVMRYLAAFGPASPADMQTWSGLQGLAATFDALRPKLHTFRDERGKVLFDLPDGPRPDDQVAAPARFLPEFDNLVLAHADRTRVLADEHKGQVVTKNLRVRATFLWDGRVAGTWDVTRKRKAATLNVRPFTSLPKRAAQELVAEGERVLPFAEQDATDYSVEIAE